MRAYFLVLILWLVAGAANAAHLSADALWQKGAYRAAFAQTIEPAIQGDAHSQYMLGEAYRLGLSVDPDIVQAEDWYGRAAGQGDVAAATELGLMLASRHQNKQAFTWLKLAAQHDEPRALAALAALYYNGDGVGRDDVFAFALMARAASLGLPEAQARLATLRGLLAPDAQTEGIKLASIEPAPVPQPALAMGRAPVAAGVLLTSNVRIQVGVFSSATAAEHGWTVLARRLGGSPRANYAVVRSGGLYLLQARLTDRTMARAFSGRLQAVHWRHFTLSSPPSLQWAANIVTGPQGQQLA